jgi:NitT/TauT family transport system substrate-binding protein
MKKSATRILSVAVATIALLGGADRRVAEAQDLPKATLRLAFTYNSHRSPYLLALDKGFYREEGFDVQVLEGKGITSAMQLVANKSDNFTIVDPPSLILGVAQGMPVRQVALMYQASPNTLITWKEQNISKPSDLVGKTVATLQGDTTATMLYALLAANGIDRNSVRIMAADAGTRTKLFLGKGAAAITGFHSDYIGLSATTGGQVNYFLYSDFGIVSMGDGIVAHLDTIASSPEMVRGVVRASIRGYQYAMEHPEESIAALMKRSPNTNRAVALEQLKLMVRLLESPDTKQHGIGYSSKAKWEQTQTLMRQFGGLTKTLPDVSVCYTNDFLPKP